MNVVMNNKIYFPAYKNILAVTCTKLPNVPRVLSSDKTSVALGSHFFRKVQ